MDMQHIYIYIFFIHYDKCHHHHVLICILNFQLNHSDIPVFDKNTYHIYAINLIQALTVSANHWLSSINHQHCNEIVIFCCDPSLETNTFLCSSSLRPRHCFDKFKYLINTYRYPLPITLPKTPKYLFPEQIIIIILL